MIYINEVEVADILATNATIDELVVNGSYGSEEDLYGELDGEGELTFKNGHILKVYNRWYDYYYDILDNNKEN